jgi:dephospho-CoA kinase
LVRVVSGKKPIIGVAGGIGSGKSTVAAILAELGSAVVSADRLNHEELNAPEVRDELRRWWGDDVLTADGRVDREAVRRLVREDGAARARLEELVHPRIARRRDALTEECQADPSVRAIVWDIPLLFEVGLSDRCDHVIFVEADPEVRRHRVRRERGWSSEDLAGFEAAQMSLDLKRTRADFRVVNNSDRGDLRRQVEDVFSRVLSEQ